MANGLFTSIKKVLNIEFSLIDRLPDKQSYVARARLPANFFLNWANRITRTNSTRLKSFQLTKICAGK